jgi:hypothetical protein
MPPPSERTINPRLALKSLTFFPDVTRECYHSVQGGRSCLVRREIRALVERNNFVHAAESELLAIGLRDVARRHLRIGPTKHRHHLALGTVGVSCDLGALYGPRDNTLGLVGRPGQFTSLQNRGEAIDNFARLAREPHLGFWTC